MAWQRFYRRPALFLILVLAFGWLFVTGRAASAQGIITPATPRPTAEPTSVVPSAVEVSPTALDAQIAERLQGILESTNWFENPRVTVQNGVVFLSGRTADANYRTWAGELASKTRDVVAVVNRIEVTQRSLWDVTPAFDVIQQIIRGMIRSLPMLVLAAFVLILTWLARRVVVMLARPVVARRVQSPLLRDLAARLFAVPVILLGLYLVLQFLGLTQLALTVLGGTGIAGLIVGIAFRDTVENLLASILLSTDRPFKTGDTVQIGQRTGVVQAVTTRATLLMGFDGNHIQIPNATVYKSEIINLSANPNLRLNFTVTISYDDSVETAQAAIMAALKGHPAVLADPEPLVLADRFAPTGIDLAVFAWINSEEHNSAKVKSALVRLSERALREAGVRIPEPGREVVFPKGVPVDRPPLFGGRERPQGAGGNRHPTGESSTPVTPAEGRLSSEDGQIQKQAERSRPPSSQSNLLPE